MASDKVHTFTDGNFDKDVLKAGAPVLVDFWAEWCGPCKRIAPTIEELANDFEGTAVIGKVNVDENPAVSMRFAVRSIPTLLVFKGGEVVEQMMGVKSKGELASALKRHV
jgi:thioredoxin 1